MKPPLACKIIREQFGISGEDIENEIRAIRRICTTKHENIVQVFSDWREQLDGVRTCLIVMELCEKNFENHLNRCHQDYEFWDWWFYRSTGLFDMKLELDLLDGLVFIHSMDEIHRDLKPTNGMTLLSVFRQF